MTETLTSEERNMLEDIAPIYGGKALRIIDQLTNELAAAERAAEAAIAGNEVATQRARDAEQRADDVGLLGKEHIEQLRGLLQNEEKNHAFTKAETATERAELLRQCELLRGEREAAEVQVRELEAEVSGLREALALERDLVTLHAGGASRAEVQVRELTERVSQALTGLRPGSPVREALEEALRAP